MLPILEEVMNSDRRVIQLRGEKKAAWIAAWPVMNTPEILAAECLYGIVNERGIGRDWYTVKPECL